jgi:hypothetical protein
LEISTSKTKVFGFVGTDHLTEKVIINDETLDQVNQFKYLGCIILYQFSNYVELKLATFFTINWYYQEECFKKVRTETNLKLYVTLVLPTFLNGTENWTLKASQRRRIEAAEMKLLRHIAGHNLNEHKPKDPIRRELQTECILDRIDVYGRN